MGCKFISTDTASKIGLGPKQHGGKSKKVKVDNVLLENSRDVIKTVNVDNLKVESNMNKVKYRLDKVADSLTIFVTTIHAADKKDKNLANINNLNNRYKSIIKNLRAVGNISVDRHSLSYLLRPLHIPNDITSKILDIAETKARFKILSKEGVDNFIKEQYNLDLLYECVGCREFHIKITKDHIYPLSKGGVDHHLNMQPMCKCCNQSKSNITENKPVVEVYYNDTSKFLLPTNKGLIFDTNNRKGKVYADNPHILTLPNLT